MKTTDLTADEALVQLGCNADNVWIIAEGSAGQHPHGTRYYALAKAGGPRVALRDALAFCELEERGAENYKRRPASWAG